jgi:hypothetical protein
MIGWVRGVGEVRNIAFPLSGGGGAKYFATLFGGEYQMLR